MDTFRIFHPPVEVKGGILLGQKTVVLDSKGVNVCIYPYFYRTDKLNVSITYTLPNYWILLLCYNQQ